ncbi:MAG: carbohydrate kinase family protein [Puniceicoccaceae bacterium]|nr:carbohydrate kinase family protein [Puniceicoccaceae bacterium]
MNLIEQTVSELRNAASFAGNKKALVGIDGFVDKIVHPVDQRTGPGSKFTAISTITDFGARISSAAGKSANIELAPVIQKLGGNGPIMANAQHAQGIKVQYIGALGNPSIHPVFKTFAQKTSAVSITDPGVTHAAEFTDGKIMFGSMASLDAITYSALIDTMGIDDLTQAFRQADAISMVNWTMIPFLSDIFDNFLNQLLPKLPKNSERIFFFDLADPEKRSADDLLNVLNLFSQFEAFGKVILGLNYREAEQIDTLLGFGKLEKNPANLQLVAARIREKLKLNTVVVHPVECAACATSQGTEFIDGPLCENPKITTGAGDHFNSGFVTARMLGLSPASALIVAVATSGYYVRTAQSPSLETIAEFISTW